MTRVTYTCHKCHEQRTVPVWDEGRVMLRAHAPMPKGWTWDYSEVRTGQPLCDVCRVAGGGIR